MNTLTEFGHSFQTKTLAALIFDFNFLQQVHDLVSDEYFDNDASKWITKTIVSYYDDYKTNPTLEVFKVKLNEVPNDVLKVAIKDQLKQIIENRKASDIDFVKDKFIAFGKDQSLKKALIRSVDLLPLGDYEGIRNLIDSALKAGTDRGVGHEYLIHLEERFKEDKRNIVPTPWEVINDLTGGGLGNGDLGLIVGGPGGGKSWTLINLGKYAVEQGYTVIHYTLELSDIYVGRRYDASFSQIPVSHVMDNKEKVKESLLNVKGNLYIKSYPTNNATVGTIRAHVQKCVSQGIQPDMIIVDYADLLDSKKGRERKDKIDEIYKDLRGLANELDILVWTASQVNRAGAQDDQVEGDKIAGSYDKMGIIDFGMSLSRKKDDKVNGTGRWHIMKNRYGSDGMTFSSTLDTSIGEIDIFESNDHESYSPSKNGHSSKFNNNINPEEAKKLTETFFNLH
jgi:archaellum biogenesis ATPase FlaH